MLLQQTTIVQWFHCCGNPSRTLCNSGCSVLTIPGRLVQTTSKFFFKCCVMSQISIYIFAQSYAKSHFNGRYCCYINFLCDFVCIRLSSDILHFSLCFNKLNYFSLIFSILKSRTNLIHLQTLEINLIVFLVFFDIVGRWSKFTL